MMTCEERQDLILLNAIGALPIAEAEDLRAHLSAGCPACAGAAAEADIIAAALPLDLDPSALPEPTTLQKLMLRVREDSDRSPFKIGPPSSAAVKRRVWPAAVAAALAAIVTAGAMWQWLGESHRFITTPDLKFVSLAGGDPQPGARGHVLWDKTHETWLVYFFDLKPPPSGKEYELWFITDAKQKLAVGMFNVDAVGNAKLTVKLPTAAGTLAAVAVTDERIGGVAQPEGHIQLSGSKID